MPIDPTQPWGVSIDYAGRATVTDGGHDIDVRVYDNTLGGPLEPDQLTGAYPAVYVTAQVDEHDGTGAALRGYGLVVVDPPDSAPVVPDPAAVQQAVAAALADFETRRAAYAALCATWAPAPAPTPTPAPEPEPEPEPEPSPAPAP
ncbi:ATP-binding protein [Streptomyces sp. NPDC056527]|uniref:ATP-binding protein n=1 Tax=Streptomyces sp. NPDC056527 TaxID=3345853 RepID=UPI0036979B71